MKFLSYSCSCYVFYKELVKLLNRCYTCILDFKLILNWSPGIM